MTIAQSRKSWCCGYRRGSIYKLSWAGTSCRDVAINSVNELTNQENLSEPELAFESHFKDPAPDVLWRLVSLRQSIDGLIKHINWYANEEAALRQMDRVRQDDGKVVAFNQYHRV
jgi:hypothetical protein